MIQVEGPGGVVIEFPAGTPPETIKAAMAKQFGGQQTQAPAAPPEQPRQSYLGGMLDSFTQGAAMGFGDELTGIESAILGRNPGGGTFDVGNYDAPFWERYQRVVDAERGQQDAFSERAPISSTVGEIAGGVGTGLGMARGGMTLMGRMPAVRGAAAEGAAYGAAYGAGEADGGDRLSGALYGGAMGGAVGGAVGGVTQQIGKILAGRNAAQQAPSVASLKGQAGAAYDRARAVNPTFDGFDQFAMQAYDTLAQEGYNVRFHPQLAAVLDDIEQITRGGTAPDLKTLEQLRRRFDAAAGSNVGNRDQMRLAGMGKRALDEFMESAAGAPAPAAAGQQGAQRKALSDVREGRQLYARSKKGEMIERMFEMAEDRAGSTYSGANVENAVRQNMRKVLDNPKLARQFNAQELDAIRTVVRGEPVQNALRKIGSMSPLRGGLIGMLMTGGAGAGLATMGPAALIPAGVAAVADSLSRAGTRSQAQAVSSMVRGGPSAAQALQTKQLSPAVRSIVRALSQQGGGAVGGITAP